ncbi:MAG: division/cell wall cluster transcriptional repressor MraZ, partial [Malacoplasma sp.]|nr:division/cell wall cluster transcriptional repressor MraZ [Malacoplasma sp.]
MFLGTYSHTIDPKNRLALPSKIAAKLSKTVIVSKGFDGCLELRSQEEFDKYSNILMSYSTNKHENRIVVRQLLANASEITIDNAKRILIPANLLKEVNIKYVVT